MSATHHQPTTSRARRVGAALACFGLVALTAACGARWDDDQRAAVLARGSGGTGVASGDQRTGGPAGGVPGSSGSPGLEATGPDEAAGGGGGGAAAGPAEAGGGAGPEGGDGGDVGAAAGGPLPCAAPSDAPGVSDTTITLGSISTLSGAVPGLGASSEGAARAYVAYRNATGGVCGRQLELRTADDAMDNGRHRALVNEMNGQVLGLIGGLGGGDAGSAALVEQLGMPVVAGAISVEFGRASTMFNINPYFANPNQSIPKFDFYHAQGVRKAAIVYPDVAQTRSEIEDRQKPQMIAAGIEVVLERRVPLSTLSYDSAARDVANSGADYLLFLADGSISASMARSMHDTGYELKMAEYLSGYGGNFAELAGPGAEGAISWIRTLPNEEPGTSPEQDAYLEWMARVSPNVPMDTFAADSWSSAKGFLDSLEALPGPITREGLLAQLRSVGQYDAGGLLGPIMLGEKRNLGCMIAMRYESGSWRRLTPAQGFLC